MNPILAGKLSLSLSLSLSHSLLSGRQFKIMLAISPSSSKGGRKNGASSSATVSHHESSRIMPRVSSLKKASLTCLCAPTKHKGSFRCRLHRGSSGKTAAASNNGAKIASNSAAKLGSNTASEFASNTGAKLASKFASNNTGGKLELGSDTASNSGSEFGCKFGGGEVEADGGVWRRTPLSPCSGNIMKSCSSLERVNRKSVMPPLPLHLGFFCLPAKNKEEDSPKSSIAMASEVRKGHSESEKQMQLPLQDCGS